MSRSYKHTPVYKSSSRSSNTFQKRQANKKVRKYSSEQFKNNGKAYRKIFESWNITDYRFYEEQKVNFDPKEINWWRKWYWRK